MPLRLPAGVWGLAALQLMRMEPEAPAPHIPQASPWSRINQRYQMCLAMLLYHL